MIGKTFFTCCCCLSHVAVPSGYNTVTLQHMCQIEQRVSPLSWLQSFVFTSALSFYISMKQGLVVLHLVQFEVLISFFIFYALSSHIFVNQNSTYCLSQYSGEIKNTPFYLSNTVWVHHTWNPHHTLVNMCVEDQQSGTKCFSKV